MAGREPPPERFSRTVRGAIGHLDPAATTQWQLADFLIRAHPNYGPLARLLPLSDRAGETLPLETWLARVERLLDLEAVARSPSEVVDGRLVLLALARLDPELDAMLRESRVRWRLERDLGYPLDDVFRPWAVPASPTALAPLWSAPGGAPSVGRRACRCEFSPDGRLLAAAPVPGGVSVWHVPTGRRLVSFAPPAPPMHIAFGPGAVLAADDVGGWAGVWELGGGTAAPVATLTTQIRSPTRSGVFSADGTLATLDDLGHVRVWPSGAGSVSPLADKTGPIAASDLAFSPDGRRLATAGSTGMLGLWDPAAGTGGAVWARESPLVRVAFSPDGRLLASAAEDGTARLTDVASGNAVADLTGHEGPLFSCAFSPDGSLLATCGEDERVRLWDTSAHTEVTVIHGGGGPVFDCAFSPDGRLVATRDVSSIVGVWDVASGREVQALDHGDRVTDIAFSPGGWLAAITSEGRLHVYEIVEAPGLLPAIVPDVPSGDDLLGVGRDADALADVITAKGTAPPLSICLLGPWGSGKSFLVNAVIERVRTLARRSRGSTSSAYCSHVRNVVFNAWNYADADVPASLVTRIFDVLADVEQEGAVTDVVVAREQLARLEEELAARSPLQERIERAQLHSQHAEKVRRRLRWVRLLTGADEAGLRALGAGTTRLRGTSKLLSARFRLALACVALMLAVVVGATIALLGAGRLWQLVSGVVAGGAAVTAALGIVRRHVRRVVAWAGEIDGASQWTSAAGDLDAAKEAERKLRRERLMSERGALAEHRTYLGVLSRVREDLALTSELLLAERAKPDAVAIDPHVARLPPVDRVVVYVDDLDRCPPRRVVEVLEAIHLLLAQPLFVVVVAVDPRWLEESLRMHCSELLGSKEPGAAEAGWRPTPQDFLEKIVQLPFALRAMHPEAARALVAALLPVADETDRAGGRADAERRAGDPAGARAGEQGAPGAPRGGEADTGGAHDAGREAWAAGGDGPRRSAPPAGASPPSLSPRALALTPAERDFAAEVATALSTPRAVKKLTNLYRLLRAGLDEHSGELDRFLSSDGPDAAEFEAALILLTVVIADPEHSSELLLSLIPPAAPVAWNTFIERLGGTGTGQFAEILEILQTQGRDGWTTAPFARWALEVSRYSFETGRRVYAEAG